MRWGGGLVQVHLVGAIRWPGKLGYEAQKILLRASSRPFTCSQGDSEVEDCDQDLTKPATKKSRAPKKPLLEECTMRKIYSSGALNKAKLLMSSRPHYSPMLLLVQIPIYRFIWLLMLVSA